MWRSLERRIARLERERGEEIPAHNSFTDHDLAMALCRVLHESERCLHIEPSANDRLGARIDRVLGAALPGELDPRAFAALQLVRNANKHAP